MNFTLDPKLEADSDFICDLPLCQIRLMKNAAYPWLILIPRRHDMSEIIDLPSVEQIQLFNEISEVSCVLREQYQPKKLNVANLGNKVSQLHIHIIARYETDPAWPNPVWGNEVVVEYTPAERQLMRERLIDALCIEHA